MIDSFGIIYCMGRSIAARLWACLRPDGFIDLHINDTAQITQYFVLILATKFCPQKPWMIKVRSFTVLSKYSFL